MAPAKEVFPAGGTAGVLKINKGLDVLWVGRDKGRKDRQQDDEQDRRFADDG